MPNNNKDYDLSKVVTPETQETIEKVEGGKAATEFLKKRAETIDNAKKKVVNLTQFINFGTFKNFEYKTEGNIDPINVSREANKVLDELEDTQKAFKLLQEEKEEVKLNNKPITKEMFNKLMAMSLDALKSNIETKQTKKNMGKLDLIDQRIKNLMPKEKISA